MNATAALPLAMCISHLTTYSGEAETGSVKFVIQAPAEPPYDATTATTSLATFRLTPEEITKFVELTANPPALNAQVIEVFKAKLAQD
jgi:hypothetical protein